MNLTNSKHKNSELFYSIKGEGVPVILLHGIAASLHDWDALVPSLVYHGYTAIALDLPGHGNSNKPQDPGYYTSDNLYQSFVDWMDDYKVDDPLVIIGHSLGGFISLRYSLDYPSRVRGLILIDPYFDHGQLSPILKILNKRPHLSEKAIRHTPLWIIDWLLGWDPIKTERFSAEARLQIAYDYKRAAPYIMHIPGTISDITSDIPKITQPILVIWGDKDQTLDPESFPRLVNMLPNAEQRKIKNAGHQPHIGDPDIVNTMVLDYLAEIYPTDRER